MEKIKELDKDLPELIEMQIIKTEEERDHLAKGLSQHGACLGKQIFSKVIMKPFTGQGATTPGTAFHEYMQIKVLPAGSTVGDYIILGHEQLIFLLDVTHKEIKRQSPIDTLVYNLKSKEFEIWDYKTTQIDLKYVNVLDKVYEFQTNLYAQTFKNTLDLPYNPLCKVIFASKNNWTDLKTFVFRSNPEMESQSIERIATVDALAKREEYENVRVHWIQFAEGLDIWSDTKNPYRKQCKYCDYNEECLANLNIGREVPFTSIDDAGDQTYGK